MSALLLEMEDKKKLVENEGWYTDYKYRIYCTQSQLPRDLLTSSPASMHVCIQLVWRSQTLFSRITPLRDNRVWLVILLHIHFMYGGILYTVT